MSEQMTFMPRAEILTLEEIEEIADAFIARGVRKIRLTGGEPLVRRNAGELARKLGARIGQGLDELTLTTNATRLAAEATTLREAGIRRINVSLDSRDPARFRHITRTGDVAKVLEGIAAAKAAGIRIKINMVALRALNEDEIEPMLRWCAGEGHDLTLIETMPLGLVEEDRTDHFLPLDLVRRRLEERFTLSSTGHNSGGPAHYVYVEELGCRLGFITPLSHNFCETCNRVRLTASGRLYMCLGQDDHVDLRDALRSGGRPQLDAAIDEAMRGKPLRHDFRIEPGDRPAVDRHMSVTGG